MKKEKPPLCKYCPLKGVSLLFNEVTLVGRLTRDPELKYTKDGIAVCNFTLAVERSFRNHLGEFEADFIPITVWRKQAENTATYCHKGAMVGVRGRIHTRFYQNKNGERVYVMDVNADHIRFLKLNSSQKKNFSPPTDNETPLKPTTPSFSQK